MAGGKLYNATRRGKNRKRVVVRRKPAISKENMSYSQAKRYGVSLIRRSMARHVYNFVRCIEDTTNTVSSNNLAFTGYAFSFKLNDVPNVTEFTSLFDTYQLCKVELTFEPDCSVVNQPLDGTTATSFTVPTIYVHRDLDNAIAPTTEAQMCQRQELIRKKATQRFKISLVPQVGREVYRSTTSTAYETPYKVIWLDANYPDIPHYGIHVGMTPTGGTAGAPRFSYKIRTKYWLRFKTVI